MTMMATDSESPPKWRRLQPVEVGCGTDRRLKPPLFHAIDGTAEAAHYKA
jgi:hypothetical protein